jgi:hypothetical protein
MHMASMAAHDCTPNCSWVIQLDSRYFLRANVPLKKGESVNFLYTEPTLPSAERRKKLLEGKYFLCGCSRCRDPTELGTFFSAVKCPNCPPGYVIPQETKVFENTKWSCTECGAAVQAEFIQEKYGEITRAVLSSVGMEDSWENVRKLFKIRGKFMGLTVHANNCRIHDVENDILQRISYLLAASTGGESESERQYWAEVMVEIARKCLGLANVIWPGYSRHRGEPLTLGN